MNNRDKAILAKIHHHLLQLPASTSRAHHQLLLDIIKHIENYDHFCEVETAKQQQIKITKEKNAEAALPTPVDSKHNKEAESIPSPENVTVIFFEILRKNLIRALSEFYNPGFDDQEDNTIQAVQLIHRILLVIARHHPTNEIDIFSQEPIATIPKEFQVALLDGNIFDIRDIVTLHNSRTYQGVALKESANKKYILHPITREPLHPLDVLHVLTFADEQRDATGKAIGACIFKDVKANKVGKGHRETILPFIAIKYGYREAIQIAMESDVDLTEKDKDGNAFLHYVARFGQVNFLHEMIARDEKDMQTPSHFIQRLALNQTWHNKAKHTPLDIAHECRKPHIIRFLCTLAINQKGDTLIHDAIRLTNPIQLQIMLEAGVDLTPKNNSCETAFDILLKMPEYCYDKPIDTRKQMVQVIQSHPAALAFLFDLAVKEDKFAFIHSLHERCGISLNPIVNRLFARQYESLPLQLERIGINVHKADEKGNTPFQRAIHNNFDAAAAIILRNDIREKRFQAIIRELTKIDSLKKIGKETLTLLQDKKFLEELLKAVIRFGVEKKDLTKGNAFYKSVLAKENALGQLLNTSTVTGIRQQRFHQPATKTFLDGLQKIAQATAVYKTPKKPVKLPKINK